MTRPIKFRAWDFENKIMHTPKIHHDEKFVLQLNCNYIGEFNGKKYESIKMNLLQFTGLTDRNGVEVYEGDLLSIDPFLQVVYLDGGFCFYNPAFTGADRLSQDRVGRLSVIGNIYQNPELLKGGNPA